MMGPRKAARSVARATDVQASVVMTQHSLPRVLKISLVSILVLTSLVSVLAEELEIHDFEARAKQKLGKQVTLLGRFQSAGAGHLRLVDSKIDFVLTKDIRLRPGLENVRLKGLLSQRAGKYVFTVEELRLVAGESEQFQAARKRIRRGDYKSLYELSRWVRERGNWYADGELKRLASTSYREAFGWEEERLASRKDAGELLALAARGARLRLEEDEVARIRHRALWLKAAELATGDAPARRRLASEVQSLLPGADVPLSAADELRRKDYLDDPLPVYSASEAAARRKLDRMFWTKLVVESLEIQSRQDDSDAGDLAREARRLVPERPALARRLRLLDLTRQASHPQRLSRGKVLALQQALAQLDETAQGQELIGSWLEAKFRRLPSGDAEQRWRLARDYHELSGDEIRAARLFQEALQIAPGIAEAKSGLRQLGFERVGGLWQRTSTLEPSQIAQMRRQRSGKLAAGDSVEDVYRRLGPPSRISRTVTRNQITEQLIYLGPPTLYVYTARKGSGNQAVVISIHSP